jgi:membrane protein DedA with SNARE-associated domain
MGIIEWAIELIKQLIELGGYGGIFVLMALESMCVPIPSEVVLPFGGWLAFDGKMDWFLVGLAGTFGCTAGSMLAYWAGMKGGRPFICKYGKYVFLNEGHLDSTERWFKKYGTPMIFLTRVMPIVRTFISLPAGMARMDFKKFVILTTIGSAIWCMALAYVGFALGTNWNTLEVWFRQADILILVAFAALLIWWYMGRRKRKKAKEAYCKMDQST